MDINIKEIYDEIASISEELCFLENNHKAGTVTDRELVRLWGLWRDFSPPNYEIKIKCDYLNNLIKHMPESAVDIVIRSFDYERWIRSLNHIKEHPESVVVLKGILEHLNILDSALRLKAGFIVDEMASKNQLNLFNIATMPPGPEWLMKMFHYRGICEGAVITHASYFKPISSHILALSSFTYNLYLPSIYYVLNTILFTEQEWNNIDARFSKYTDERIETDDDNEEESWF